MAELGSSVQFIHVVIRPPIHLDSMFARLATRVFHPSLELPWMTD